MQVEWSRHGLAWGLARLDHLKGLAVMGRGRPRYLNHRAGNSTTGWRHLDSGRALASRQAPDSSLLPSQADH